MASRGKNTVSDAAWKYCTKMLDGSMCEAVVVPSDDQGRAADPENFAPLYSSNLVRSPQDFVSINLPYVCRCHDTVSRLAQYCIG